MVLENTKYGVGVSPNGRRVTECFVESSPVVQNVQNVQTHLTACGRQYESAASCHISCKSAFWGSKWEVCKHDRQAVAATGC